MKHLKTITRDLGNSQLTVKIHVPEQFETDLHNRKIIQNKGPYYNSEDHESEIPYDLDIQINYKQTISIPEDHYKLFNEDDFEEEMSYHVDDNSMFMLEISEVVSKAIWEYESSRKSSRPNSENRSVSFL